MDEPLHLQGLHKTSTRQKNDVSNNETTVFSVSHGHFIQRDSKNSEPAFAINEGFDESAHR